jgi:hypothetical protein
MAIVEFNEGGMYRPGGPVSMQLFGLAVDPATMVCTPGLVDAILIFSVENTSLEWSDECQLSESRSRRLHSDERVR